MSKKALICEMAAFLRDYQPDAPDDATHDHIQTLLDQAAEYDIAEPGGTLECEDLDNDEHIEAIRQANVVPV